MDHERNKKLKSEYMYLKGKALDYRPEYQKEAEELLTKASKLRPTWHEPLNALGHVYWKKKDFENAIMCYKQAMEEEPEDKTALRNLSMVIRQQQGMSKEELTKAHGESIELAKRALNLDIVDSHSWYVLGNAHLTSYFQNPDQYENLQDALKAYTMAEKNQDKDHPNPDLYYNRATIRDYLEQYGPAIADYVTADSIDPSLKAKEKCGRLIEFVSMTSRMINKRNESKNKKDAALVKQVPSKFGEVRFPSGRDEE